MAQPKISDTSEDSRIDYYILTRGCFLLGFLSGMFLWVSWLIVPFALTLDFLYQHPENVNKIYFTLFDDINFIKNWLFRENKIKKEH